MTEHLWGNRYVTLIHMCVSGMVKLSRVSRIPEASKVHRWMAGIRLPKCSWSGRGGAGVPLYDNPARCCDLA